MVTERLFVKGNEAVAMAAIDAGCLLYFGYPITPQNDIPEYLSKHLRQVGVEFVQAESEIASINMLLGAAATGTRAMTSSSSPGISLMQEGISYMAGSELPAVIVNMSRSGPGLGVLPHPRGTTSRPPRGGKHGDYRTIVLGPSSVQEIYDLTRLAFDLADLTGFSAALLSQIENHLISPSLGTIVKIARSVNLPLGHQRHSRLVSAMSRMGISPARFDAPLKIASLKKTRKRCIIDRSFPVYVK